MKQTLSSEDDLINFAKQAHDADMSYGQYQAKMYSNKIIRKPFNTPVSTPANEDSPKGTTEVFTSHSKRFC